jgi:hypothetical protein
MTVFPIGHYMGERHPEDLHFVRVGLQHQTMTADEFGVWVLSHGGPQWTVEDVLAQAARARLPNPSASFERLLSVGLLATVTDPEAFARSYRLHPLLTGLGNTEEDPNTYVVGIPGLEAARLTAGSYELWQWSALAPTLWHTCEIRAKLAEMSAPEAADEVLADLRPVLANSCGYLDKAR